jgi:L-ascorbate metabolism protein UlaG (beta-lactamase superfamily)
MKTTGLSIVLGLCVLLSCKQNPLEKNATADKEAVESAENMNTDFNISPISHATAVFTIGETVFYIDPVGGQAAFDNQPSPDVILVTDIHGDHFNMETLKAVTTSSSKIIVPQAVASKIDDQVLVEQLRVLNNEESVTLNDFTIEAIAMYNKGDQDQVRHTKGRGNGYVIQKDSLRVYFSGDTENIPEMQSLKDIDKAFVCMNLPYTMSVEEAAKAVLAFQPEEVYPYHYRGQGGLADVDQFKTLVNAENTSIEVVQLNWYPEQE